MAIVFKCAVDSHPPVAGLGPCLLCEAVRPEGEQAFQVTLADAKGFGDAATKPAAGHWLRRKYDGLPDAAKDEVFALLHRAIKYRGGGGLRDITIRGVVQEIAGAFERHTGDGFEEYT